MLRFIFCFIWLDFLSVNQLLCQLGFQVQVFDVRLPLRRCWQFVVYPVRQLFQTAAHLSIWNFLFMNIGQWLAAMLSLPTIQQRVRAAVIEFDALIW